MRRRPRRRARACADDSLTGLDGTEDSRNTDREIDADVYEPMPPPLDTAGKASYLGKGRDDADIP